MRLVVWRGLRCLLRCGVCGEEVVAEAWIEGAVSTWALVNSLCVAPPGHGRMWVITYSSPRSQCLGDCLLEAPVEHVRLYNLRVGTGGDGY